jgi:hypothetical protein
MQTEQQPPGLRSVAKLCMWHSIWCVLRTNVLPSTCDIEMLQVLEKDGSNVKALYRRAQVCTQHPALCHRQGITCLIGIKVQPPAFAHIQQNCLSTGAKTNFW